jgi:hypothetical protein
MLGKLIGWSFDLIGNAWTAFWNALGRFLGLVALTVLCGAAAASCVKLYGSVDAAAWIAFKWGAFGGFMAGIIRLGILAGVSVVHTQEQRERRRRQREIDALARRDRQREYLSDRLKLLQ